MSRVDFLWKLLVSMVYAAARRTTSQRAVSRAQPLVLVAQHDQLWETQDSTGPGETSCGLTAIALVSVSPRNWSYLCEKVERVEIGELVETANIHAGFMQVGENMVG